MTRSNSNGDSRGSISNQLYAQFEYEVESGLSPGVQAPWAIIGAMRWLLGLMAMAVVSGCSDREAASPENDGADVPSHAPLIVSETSSDVFEVPAGPCFSRGPGDYVDSIERPEGPRSFLVHVPPSYDGRYLVPVLFNFHGQARMAQEQEDYSGLVPLSDARGFILVAPEGGSYPQQWDIVGVYAEDGVDDVGTVAQILEHVQAEFCTDPGRVFATGISNGGQMAAQVGCFLPDKFAGIAPVAGIVYQGCEGPPVAVITFHGTADYNVPYESAPEAVIEWARYNGCPEEPETERVGEKVVRISYFGCEGAPVVFYTLEDGGHTWPGAVDESGGIGPTNHEIDASALIWDLFGRIRRSP